MDNDILSEFNQRREDTAEESNINENTKSKKNKSKKLNIKNIVIAIIVIVILGLIVGGISHAVKNSKSNNAAVVDNLFDEDLLAVKSNGQWQYINKKGKAVITTSYSNVEPFVNGFAIVSNDDGNGNSKFGFINKKGTEIASCTYDYVEQFSDGLALVVSGDKCGFINEKGETEISINIPYIAGVDNTYKFENGQAVIFSSIEGNKIFTAVIDKKGEYIIEPQCDHSYKSPADKQGRRIVCTDLSNGENRYGVVDNKGEFIIPASYESITNTAFNNGNTFVVGLGGKYGLIDSNNEFIVNPTYDSIILFPKLDNNTTYAVIETRDKFGLMDGSGKVIVSPQFDQIPYPSFTDGLTPVRMGNLYGFINKDGELKIDPTYEATSVFVDGIACVYQNGKCGYINTKGEQVIAPQFDSALSFDNGAAWVEMSDKYGLIDKDAEYIISPIYSNVDAFGSFKIKDVDLIRVTDDNGEVGYFNTKKQEETIIPQYEEGSWFYSDGFAVVLDSSQKYNIINTKGNVINKEGYDEIKYYQTRATIDIDGSIIDTQEYKHFVTQD